MSNYHFLLTRRWIILGLILVIASIACVRLGMWQYDRHEYKVERSEQIEGYYDADPLPLPAEVAHEGATIPPQWQTVELTGSFVGDAVFAPHRPVAGSAADHALGIFQDAATGQFVAVNRGWFPTDVFSEPDDTVQLPVGQITIVGHVRSPEPVFSTTMASGQVRSMNPGRIWQEATGHQPIPSELIESFYLEVGTDYIAAGAGLNGHVRPETGIGNHLSYALQWWTFALGCLAGYVILARREVSDAAAEAAVDSPTTGIPSTSVPGPRHSSTLVGQSDGSGAEKPERRRRKKVGSQDSDEEDSLIDAQMG